MAAMTDTKHTPTFTEADYNGWHFKRDAVHFNGGREFFGYGHHCIEQPRLLVIDKYFKKDRSTQRSWQIDGKTIFTALVDALSALSVPPSLSADEATLLRGLPEGWSKPETRGDLLPLAYMGLIKWGRDQENCVICCVTDAGRAALAKAQESGQ